VKLGDVFRRWGLARLPCVDLAIPDYAHKQKKTGLWKHKVDIFAISEDRAGKFDELSEYAKAHHPYRDQGRVRQGDQGRHHKQAGTGNPVNQQCAGSLNDLIEGL